MATTTSSILREERLIMFDVRANHNKWWRIELYANGDVWTHWGRVREGCQDGGQSKCIGHGDWFYERKLQEKLAKGYRRQEVIENAAAAKASASVVALKAATKQIETNTPEAEKLVEEIAQQNRHQIQVSTNLVYNAATGLFKTPLGVVTQRAVNEARRHLATIAEHVSRRDYLSWRLDEAINRYMALIPQDIGMRRLDPAEFFGAPGKLEHQSGILDALEASLSSLVAVPPAGGDAVIQEQIFQVKLHLVTDAAEIQRIRDEYRKNRDNAHQAASYKVGRVFTVEIGQMREAFEAQGKRIGNVHALAHGTNVGNLLSIFHKGLVIPKSATNGRAFGDGIYTAPCWTKALNYCVAPNVKVLKSDLTWVEAKDLDVGDELLAFDEERQAEGRGRATSRRWRLGNVTAAGRAWLPSVEVVFENGEKMIVSRDHMFLYNREGSKVEWIKAGDLKVGYRIPKYLEPWQADRSYNAGWLAGFFDGEGCINQYGISASQKPGPTYEALVARLQAREREDWTIARRPNGSSNTHGVWLKGPINTRARFLGQVRPERLIRNFIRQLTQNTIFQRLSTTRVAAVYDLGLQNVVTLSTSTRTFIADGYAAHNSGGYWQGTSYNKCFMFLCQIAVGRAYTPTANLNTQGYPKPGYDSTWAKKGTAYGGFAHLRHDEVIVYKLAQVNPTHLIEFAC